MWRLPVPEDAIQRTAESLVTGSAYKSKRRKAKKKIDRGEYKSKRRKAKLLKTKPYVILMPFSK